MINAYGRQSPSEEPKLNMLPTTRPRALTLPLPVPQEPVATKWWTVPMLSGTSKVEHQKTFQQEQCPLFKFPREIRDLIWRECLGGKVLHIGFPDGKETGYLACKNPMGTDQSQLDAWISGNGCLISCWSDQGATHGPGKRHLLGLSLTCRRIYSESIDYLYSTNTFDLMNPFFLNSLPSLLLPHRLNAIKSIQLLWALYSIPISTDSAESIKLCLLWKDVWNVLRDMQGLKILKVECFSGFELRGEAEREMIGDVKKVVEKGLDVFELRLMSSEMAGDVEGVLGEGFRVIRSTR